MFFEGHCYSSRCKNIKELEYKRVGRKNYRLKMWDLFKREEEKETPRIWAWDIGKIGIANRKRWNKRIGNKNVKFCLGCIEWSPCYYVGMKMASNWILTFGVQEMVGALVF